MQRTKIEWRYVKDGDVADDFVELDDGMGEILAVVDTVGGTRYFIGHIDENSVLVDQDDNESGWDFENIDRWCPMSEVMEFLDGRMHEETP